MARPTYNNAQVNRANYNGSVPIAWNNAGGDWWDANYVPNGTTPWASQIVQATSTPRQIDFDVTALFQGVYDNPDHLSAVIVCGLGGASTQWAMFEDADPVKRPKINYDGGADIVITEDTGLENSSFGGFPTAALRNVNPNLGTTTYFRLILNVPPPVTRPNSATLKLFTTAQFGNVNNMIFWLRYPPQSAPSAGGGAVSSSVMSKGIARGIERGIV
jgi:hypothetical protein